MNIIKRMLKAINDHAQFVSDMYLDTFLDQDTHQVCRHCGQNVTDKNINHAATGCTVNVREL